MDARDWWSALFLFAAFLVTLSFAGAFWLFTLFALWTVWGMRVTNEITFDTVPHDWLRRYGSAR